MLVDALVSLQYKKNMLDTACECKASLRHQAHLLLCSLSIVTPRPDRRPSMAVLQQIPDEMAPQSTCFAPRDTGQEEEQVISTFES